MPTEPDPSHPQSAPEIDPERIWRERAPLPPLANDFPEPVSNSTSQDPAFDDRSLDVHSRRVFRLPRRPRHIPNIGHTLIFLIIAAAALILTEIAAVAIAMGTHIFGREATAQLLRDPRLLIPTMAVSYLLAGAVAWAIFSDVWKQPFSRGIHWNSGLVGRRFYAFLAIGIGLSVTVQLLSNFLPIPKALPIDDFFRTPIDVWLVAVFGTFVAPVFEELAFRGFLFPSLASAWDWLAKRNTAVLAPGNVTEVSSGGSWLPETTDPKWSIGALIFSSTITSIGFALLHADQLAHSWAPLLILFSVSVVLCLVRLLARSLAASTLVHATYNCTIFVLMFFATDGFRHLDKLN